MSGPVMAIIFLAITVGLAGVFLIGRRLNAGRRAPSTHTRNQLTPRIPPVSKTQNGAGQAAQ